ncbi:MAG TPA: class I SAM-dependent methyltransferase [Candidatus Saccharimonadales bacterium]|nr:class I SAM-dependent methyltransferase [Candidatus Saccharimonadales bacterium]
MSAYTGTAQYYDLYRPSIPGEVVERVVAAVTAQASSAHLLDLGTGTGKVLERFLPHFTDIIAVEPEDEMMALAKRRLVPHMAADTSIHFVTGRAEDMEIPEEWHASLVTICRAFHWMDQAAVLQKLNQIVAPSGVIAVLNDKSIWNLQEPWCIIVKGVVQEILGQERRAGDDLFNPPKEPFSQIFAASAFSKVEEFSVHVERTWTVDQIIGYLYSNSFAAKPLFGDYVEQFESAVHQRLEPLAEDDGTFKEHNEFSVLLATRP